jgi:type IV pilus assembly protein PilZ
LREEAVVDAVVRWSKPDGMGVQFGVMGARETHALTQMLSSKD